MDKLFYNDIEISKSSDLSNYEFDYLDENGDTHLKSKTTTTRIAELKQKLNNTDYQAIKYAEGEMTAEEYERIKTYRKQWRKEINDLEKTLKN